MAVIHLTPRVVDGGAVLPRPAIAARDSAPPRPGAGHVHGNSSSKGTPANSSTHSSGLDAIAALVGVVFVVLILGGIWLFNRFRRMPQQDTPPHVEKKQHDKSATIAMLDALSAPVSKREWQSALNEKEDALMVNVNVTAQDACAICLDPITDADAIRPLPCRHVFHQACFDRWFWKTAHHHRNPTKCPLCRTDFLVDAPRLPEKSHLAP